MASSKSIKLPRFEHAKSYRSWRSRVVAQLKRFDAWDGVEEALQYTDEHEPLWPNGGVAAVRQKRVDAYADCYAALGESVKLDSEVDLLLISHGCDNLVDSLRLMDDEYLELQTVDENFISQQFNSKPWDHKTQTLKDWINSKWADVQRLTEEYPNDVSRNRAMCRVLCDGVPKIHFKTVTARFRTKVDAQWRKLAAALKDHDKVLPMSKSESDTKAMNTDIEELKSDMAKLKKSQTDVAANYNGGGHWEYGKDNGGWKGKGGNKGKGKERKGPYYPQHYNSLRGNDETREAEGGKGAGKKKGGFSGICDNCGGEGHTWKFCTSGKSMEELKKMGL